MLARHGHSSPLLIELRLIVLRFPGEVGKQRQKKEKGLHCGHRKAGEECKTPLSQAKKPQAFIRFDRGRSLKGRAE